LRRSRIGAQQQIAGRTISSRPAMSWLTLPFWRGVLVSRPPHAAQLLHKRPRISAPAPRGQFINLSRDIRS